MTKNHSPSNTMMFLREELARTKAERDQLRARVAELEKALNGVMQCRQYDCYGDAIEEILRDEFAAADAALSRGGESRDG